MTDAFTAAGQLRFAYDDTLKSGVLYGNTDANLETSEFFLLLPTMKDLYYDEFVGVNTAPEIHGLPNNVKHMPIDTEVGLVPFSVSDAQSSTLTVTLVAENGTLGGLVDEDADIAGFQLSGTAESINSRLSALSFKAGPGDSHIAVSVDDGQLTTEGRYAMFTPYLKTGKYINESYKLISAVDINYDSIMMPKHTGERTISNEGIVDAEKAADTPMDDNQCWAGVTANMLVFTGWAEEAGKLFSNAKWAEDAIFDEITDSFLYGDKLSGNAIFGAEWFFNGADACIAAIYENAMLDGNADDFAYWDKPKEGTGGQVVAQQPDVNLFMYGGYTLYFDDPGLSLIEYSLQCGAPLALTVGWYETDSFELRKGGHNITVWGYTYIEDYDRQDPKYLTGLIVSDSDDDQRHDSPLDAPDSLHVYSLKYDRDIGYYFGEDYVSGGNRGLIESVSTLLPSTMPTEDIYETVKAYAATGVTTVGVGPDLVCESA
jgi:hypothetical protein